MKTTPVLLGGVLILGLLSGCNTTATSVQNTTGKPAEEYVTIEPETGSRVKKRVKKSELAAAKKDRSGNQKKFEGDDILRILPQTAGQVEAAVTANGP